MGFPMAQAATFTAPARNITGLLLAPFRATVNFLISMAEARPMMQQINRLNATTDAQLASRGLTRDSEIRRIFGAQFYI